MNVYIAGPARTPIGAHGGVFSDIPAPVLGSTVVRATLERSGLSPGSVDEVFFGNVLSAGLGQNVARQVAIGAGLPDSVPATTVDKVCGSGLKSIITGAQTIRCGDNDVVLAGGTESMTQAPHTIPTVLSPRRGPGRDPVDTMVRDGLWDVYNDMHMGTCGDRCAEALGFSRQAQDDYAVESYRRALASQEAGRFDAEIVPVDAASGQVRLDEEPARFHEEKLRALPPAFSETGTVTAANASGVSDGAASVLLLSESALRDTGAVARARLLGCASAAREPEWFTLAPIRATARLLEKLSLTVEDVDVFEINEAFSCVPMAAMRELAIPPDRVNCFGGAVALGHPIGATGCRTLVTLLAVMAHRSARIGVVSLCIGGGEALAVAVERA